MPQECTTILIMTTTTMTYKLFYFIVIIVFRDFEHKHTIGSLRAALDQHHSHILLLLLDGSLTIQAIIRVPSRGLNSQTLVSSTTMTLPPNPGEKQLQYKYKFLICCVRRTFPVCANYVLERLHGK